MLVTLTTIAYKSFRMISSVDSIVSCWHVVHECIACNFGLNIYSIRQVSIVTVIFSHEIFCRKWLYYKRFNINIHVGCFGYVFWLCRTPIWLNFSNFSIFNFSLHPSLPVLSTTCFIIPAVCSFSKLCNVIADEGSQSKTSYIDAILVILNIAMSLYNIKTFLHWQLTNQPGIGVW